MLVQNSTILLDPPLIGRISQTVLRIRIDKLLDLSEHGFDGYTSWICLAHLHVLFGSYDDRLLLLIDLAHLSNELRRVINRLQ